MRVYTEVSSQNKLTPQEQKTAIYDLVITLTVLACVAIRQVLI